MATFSVAMLAKEDPVILKVWVDHYVGLGAHCVTIYTDGPAGPAADLAGGPVSVVACDAAFWHARHGRAVPRAINERQSIVTRHALDTHDTDWLLFLDSDEFVVSETPLAEVLDMIPAGTDVVRLPNYEAVWGPEDMFGAPFGSSYLRRRAVGRRDQIVQFLAYGPMVRFLSGGLTGHGEGKQLRRIGARYDRLENHVTYRDGAMIAVWAWNVLPAPVPWFIHFDAISLERLREKFRRRTSGETTAPMMGRTRENQITWLDRASLRGAPDGDRSLRRLYRLSRIQVTLLSWFNLVWRYRHPLLDISLAPLSDPAAQSPPHDGAGPPPERSAARRTRQEARPDHAQFQHADQL